ncbi:thermonuclease family protein [Ensifer sp. YR511]|uniref:thermonuclease family protein n=1 Tax=Ensifer sp. YR511 TaxID=1855294 RepID=UPI0008847950|nr:thermonuclease family protein [Ensifer sp. YR511]SDN95907.1 Endonuclease YncB, thermonuclease family [Ensifer sp. YR511]
MIQRGSLLALCLVALAPSAGAADPVLSFPAGGTYPPAIKLPVFSGRVAVIDGRTLWYPRSAAKVRLFQIDACELPQWSFDIKSSPDTKNIALRPVPCGPLAKAWLRRVVGNNSVVCHGVAYDADGVLRALCTVRGRDIALEMLRVGWSRVIPSAQIDAQYIATQRYAMSARYGMWGTYVLDMNEWRRKAVDRTKYRRPVADRNLLGERQSEISPPFLDARQPPIRTDR